MTGSHASWPSRCDHIALVLQGGGALGAYQAGVYQALHENGLEPSWINGVSIGGVNAAIIAGNPPERRIERLREFWDMVTSRQIWLWSPDGDDPRKLRNAWSAWLTMSLGTPGFFTPHHPNPLLSLRGASTATSFYDNHPLRETLHRLVDFELLNSGDVRYACGAVHVGTGNFRYFDNAQVAILPEHVVASAAMPPGLPMVRIGTDYYWDGGVVSNTPLQHLLENTGSDNVLVFQIDLFSARGALPRDMADVLGRMKDISFSSRTRLVTDYYMAQHRQKLIQKKLLAKIPEDRLDDGERALREELANLPEITILQMIYQQKAYEGQAKDYEFSGTSMREHWDAGYDDTLRTLSHRDWLAMAPEDGGVIVHDVHRIED
ncbi:MAG: patatin-like phospholipase family protein [Acetobacteraceae bacterium]|nr:patatin-like phospholipase family protein [Acetobacteraceae bacterium]